MECLIPSGAAVFKHHRPPCGSFRRIVIEVLSVRPIDYSLLKDWMIDEEGYQEMA